MTKLENSIEIVQLADRPFGRSVRRFRRACARFTALGRKLFGENHLYPALRRGTTVALWIASKKNLVEEKRL
jgi:hypothetical protein